MMITQRSSTMTLSILSCLTSHFKFSMRRVLEKSQLGDSYACLLCTEDYIADSHKRSDIQLGGKRSPPNLFSLKEKVGLRLNVNEANHN